MRKVEMDGEIYYENKGKFLNSSFIEVDLETKTKLAKKVLGSIDFKKLEIYDLLQFAKDTKESEQYGLCREVCEFGLSKFDSDESFVKSILPVLTSTYRSLNNPQEAIRVAEIQRKKCRCDSIALFTSLAAAYCDVKNYEMAKKYADVAYAKQGGGTGHENELSLVYKRIKKELGDKYV